MPFVNEHVTSKYLLYNIWDTQLDTFYLHLMFVIWCHVLQGIIYMWNVKCAIEVRNIYFVVFVLLNKRFVHDITPFCINLWWIWTPFQKYMDALPAISTKFYVLNISIFYAEINQVKIACSREEAGCASSFVKPVFLCLNEKQGYGGVFLLLEIHMVVFGPASKQVLEIISLGLLHRNTCLTKLPPEYVQEIKNIMYNVFCRSTSLKLIT